MDGRHFLQCLLHQLLAQQLAECIEKDAIADAEEEVERGGHDAFAVDGEKTSVVTVARVRVLRLPILRAAEQIAGGDAADTTPAIDPNKLEKIEGGKFRGGVMRLNSIEEYPEYQNIAWNNPMRSLPGDVEHRANLWASYNMPTPIGNFDVSLLQRFSTGLPYYASALVDPRFDATRNPNGVVNPGYVSAPATVAYYFMNEGEFRTDDVTSTDLAFNYSLPIFGVEAFFQSDIVNVFDEDAIAFTHNTAGSVLQTAVFVNRTRSSLAAFNPITETPQEGVHYDLHQNFGQPTNTDAYQQPRTYRFSVGLRF